MVSKLLGSKLFDSVDWLLFGADVLLKVTLLMALAACAAWALRSRSAAARHRLWCLAFAAAWLIPLLVLFVPAWQVPILPIARNASLERPSSGGWRPTDRDVIPHPPRAAASGDAKSVASAGTNRAPLPTQPKPASVPIAVPAPATSSTDAATTSYSVWSLERSLLAVWLSGCLLAMLPLIRGELEKRRLLRAAQTSSDPKWQGLLDELRALIGWRRPVRLLILPQDIMPMACGVLIPTILLPASCHGWSHQRRRAVLLHELSHIERRDLPLQWLARSLCAVYWFHPLVWFGLRRMGIERERACDDCVVHAGVRASDYAAELVDMAAAYRAWLLAAGVAMARPSLLEDRIRTLFDNRRPHRPLARGGGAALLLASMAVLLAIVVLRPVGRLAQADEPNAQKAPAAETPANVPKRTSAPAAGAPGPRVDSLGDPLPEAALVRMGTLRFQPPTGVDELGLSPDEKTIVTLGDEMIAWNTETGEPRWQISPQDVSLHLNSCYGMKALAYSPDGKRIYIPNTMGQLVVIDAANGKRELLTIQSKLKPAGPVATLYKSIDISPDGQRLAVGSANGLVVCDLAGHVEYEIANQGSKEIQDTNKDRLRFGGNFSYGIFSPDGKSLAMVLSEKPDLLKVLDAATGEPTAEIPLKAWLVRMAFSPDSKRIVATERDSAVRMYEADSGAELWSHVVKLDNIYENYTSAVAYSPDAKLVAACATDHGIYLLNAESGEELAKLKGHHWYPWTLAFTADSKMLYSSGWEGTLRRWDVAAREQLPVPQGVRSTAVCAASPDGRLLAYQDDGGTIHLLNKEDGSEQLLSVPGSMFGCLEFSSDGRWLAGGGGAAENVQVTILDVASGKILRRWDWPRGRDPHSTVEEVHFSPDGTRLAAAVFRQNMAYLWDLASGDKLADLAHGHVYGLSFSPDNQTLATAGWDSQVRLWRADNGALKQELDVRTEEDQKLRNDCRMYTIRYSPDGSLLATAHLSGNVRIWQADTMTRLKSFSVPPRFIYSAMAFSPDGLWLATGGMSGDVHLWDPLTGQAVWKEGHHRGYVYTVGFGHDSRTLLSGGEDGLCYLWNLRPQSPPRPSDPAKLWQELVGEDGSAAYRAVWKLAETPDEAVKLIAEKLRPIEVIIDADRTIPPDQLPAFEQRLANNEPSVSRALPVRRALAALSQTGTLEARKLLEELAAKKSRPGMSRLAEAALGQFASDEQP